MTKPTSVLRYLIPSMGLLRVTGYFAFAFTIAGALAARSLYADAREAGYGIGRTLSGLDDVTGDAETILLNGARIHRAGAVVDVSVDDVLDRYEDYCSHHPNEITEALRTVPVATRQRELGPFANRAMLDGIVRDGRKDEGFIACFIDDSAGPKPAPGERLRAFMKTGDISRFGKFRYAIAIKQPDGATHVSTVWADGEVNVGKMFPSTGDATGDDSTLLPRPPDSRRIVSAAAEHQPYGVRVYETQGSVGDVRAFYEKALADSGFKPVAKTSDDGGTYMREGLIVLVSYARSGTMTTVSLVEGGRGDATATSAARVTAD